MPNSGNGDPTDPLPPVGSGGAQPLAPGGAPAGSDRAAEVSGSGGPEAAQAAESVAGSPDPDAIASALASGALDPRTARAQLIDRAVRAQLPRDATPETVAAIRAEVEALLGDDPVLEQLLQP